MGVRRLPPVEGFPFPVKGRGGGDGFAEILASLMKTVVLK